MPEDVINYDFLWTWAFPFLCSGTTHMFYTWTEFQIWKNHCTKSVLIMFITYYRTLDLTVVWIRAYFGIDTHSQLKNYQWWKENKYVCSPLLNIKCNCKVYTNLYIITSVQCGMTTLLFFKRDLRPFCRTLIEKIPMWWNHGKEVKRNNPTLTSSPKMLPLHSPGPFRE